MGEVVEGVPTASEVVALAKKHKLHLPLFFAVNEIIAGRLTAKSALSLLMRTPPGKETFT